MINTVKELIDINRLATYHEFVKNTFNNINSDINSLQTNMKNYLPLSGGDMTGDIKLKISASSLSDCAKITTTNGDCLLYSNGFGTNLGNDSSMTVIHSGTGFIGGINIQNLKFLSAPTSSEVPTDGVYTFGTGSAGQALMTNGKNVYWGDVSTVTKISELENDSGFVNSTYVDTAIANLVDSAPEALNTLGELAIALEKHEDAYDALLETVGNKANTADVVDLTSAQTITGIKTFTQINYANDARISSEAGIFRFGNASDLNAIGVFAAAGSTYFLRPGLDNKSDLGTSTVHWRHLYLSGKILNGTYTYTLPSSTGTLALTSDLDTLVPNTRTVNGKSLSSNISLGYSDVKALPNFSININHNTGGNPRHVKFLTVDYSNYTSSASAYFKLSATSCHGNGTSYQFLEDIIIGVTSGGSISFEVYKYCQISTGYTIDGALRYYGDVYYVIDTTNKLVDFYILCGQYASSQFTPFTKIGATTTSGITQYSETASYYSSGDRVWANGDGCTYARSGDIKTYTAGTGISISSSGVISVSYANGDGGSY